MTQHELLVQLDRRRQVSQTGGQAALRHTESGATLIGTETSFGFQFRLVRSGSFKLSYEPTPGVVYAWNVSVNLSGSDLQVTTATNPHSTDISHMSFQRDSLLVLRATLYANLDKYWDDRAREAIGYARGQAPPTYAQMNQRITRAYADVYLSNSAVFKWAGMAAFASKAVGGGMAQADSLSQARIPLPPIPGVRWTEIMGTEMQHWLATGNMLVYADIYWQHLAYREAGLGMLAYEFTEGRLRSEPLAGWRAIDSAASGPSGDVWPGNRALLEYEQTKTLQEGVYDEDRELWRALSNAPMTWFLDLGSPIPGDPNAFAGTDFGDPDQRWAWIDGLMLPAWRALDADQPTARRLVELLR